jgi:hypothetical protein
MNLQSVGTRVIGAAALMASFTLHSSAQISNHAQASSASDVSAEMTKGKLNPADSKPGDTVALKLKDDVKSNGEVVLKKGTTITGVIKNVKRADSNTTAKGEARGPAQSMMEIEWLAPEAQGRTPQNLSIALQSVTQVNPVYPDEQSDALSSAVGSSSGGTASAPTRASSYSNAALRNMPSVVALDHQASSAIESGLGTSSSGELFKVGHGRLVTAAGSPQSVDIYSHLSNDTVITSSGRNFEITSGAQMQLLVGVNRK